MIFLSIERIGNISLSKQIDFTKNTIETNTQTIDYIDENHLNNNKMASIIINPTPSLTDNYIWIPQASDDYVPGLDSLLTYIQSKHATINALQNAINNINNTINNEIVNIQTEINNLEVNTPQTVNKNLPYHTNQTDFMYPRNNTNHNYNYRKHFALQQHYFTYQRKSNQELQIQLLNNIIAYLQNQINNFNTSSPPPDNNEPEVGTM